VQSMAIARVCSSGKMDIGRLLLQVFQPGWKQFNGSKTIREIDVVTTQDNHQAPLEPTESTTFTQYGLSAFQVQYWNGSTWVTITDGNVSGNNKVWKKFGFAAITTTKIRVLSSASPDSYSRLTEVEAWTDPSPAPRYNLAQGATAWWEGWRVDTDFFGQPWPPGEHHNISLAHGYGSAPTYFLSTLALGVRPVGPGFARFLVAPGPGAGLDWADGVVPSPRGPITVSWARTSQAFNLSFTVPSGSVATVSIPRMPLDEITADGNVVWRGGPLAPPPARLRIYGAAQGRVLMDAQPGAYVLVSR